MRKLLALSLSLLLTLSLVGCFEKPLSPALNTQQITQQQSVVEETKATTVAETVVATEQTSVANDENIGEEEAKKIALEHAGLKEADVSHLFVELDFDDGVLRYEIDFRQGQYEYDYDIDAETGNILSYDKDIDD